MKSHFPPELSKPFVFLSTFGNQLDLGMDQKALLASSSSHPGDSPADLQNCQIQWRTVRHWWGLGQIREYFELTHTQRHIFTTWHSTAEPLHGGGSGLSSSTQPILVGIPMWWCFIQHSRWGAQGSLSQCGLLELMMSPVIHLSL